MTRKITKLVLLALLAAPLVQASAAGPGPGEESGMTTICYYGVTMKVSQKIAKRYLKLGATMGGCGEKQPEECPLGTFPSKEGCVPIIIWIPELSMVEKPADSEKTIQLDLTKGVATKRLLSLNTREAFGR